MMDWFLLLLYSGLKKTARLSAIFIFPRAVFVRYRLLGFSS